MKKFDGEHRIGVFVNLVKRRKNHTHRDRRFPRYGWMCISLKNMQDEIDRCTHCI